MEVETCAVRRILPRSAGNRSADIKPVGRPASLSTPSVPDWKGEGEEEEEAEIKPTLRTGE